MLGLSTTTGQFSLGQITAATAEFIGPDKYMQALAEPVRARPRSPAAMAPYFAMDPRPLVSFGWFEPLSEPVRKLPALKTGENPFFFLQPAPSPFVATGWFEPLSEPVRTRPRSPAAMAPFHFMGPAPSPFVATGWFMALGEPVRKLPGLAATRQQFFAAPSQLRPPPTTTGVLDALETKDTMLAAARVWERATSGEIGVIENAIGDGEAGVSANTITSASVSIRIVV